MKRSHRHSTLGIAVLTAVTSMAAIVCNRADNAGSGTPASDSAANNQTVANQTEPGSTRAQISGEAMTLTGCLQKQDRLIDRYILTENVKPAETPVTAGTSGSVERERLREAMHSYELKGMHGDLEKLVGSQVRLTATVDESSTLPGAATANGSAGGGDIHSSDLTAVNVQRVEQVASQCERASQ